MHRTTLSSSRKYPAGLTLVIVLGIILASCSPQTPAPTLAVGPSSTSLPTDPPEPTATLTPLPTDTPTPVPTSTPVPTATATPGPTIGSTRTFGLDNMVQVYVPAGEFIMGSDDIEAQQSTDNGRAYPEIPQHTVYLDAYWIDKYEVTNAQYAMCIEAGGCEPPHSPASYTYTKYFGNPEFDNYPVIWVSWYQARGYCEWAGRRLPNEAEWEKASRGTEGQKYPWGDDPVDGEKANFCDVNCTRGINNPRFDDGYPDTAPVGSYPEGASPYGALDMSGNVWEWVSSLIKDYPYDATDGREDLEKYGERTWRGGPWSNGYWWMRSSVRYRSVPFYKWYVLGIRCAASE